MKNKLWLVLAARLTSLFMLAGIIVLGIMAYGMANSKEVKVDRSQDITFTNQATTMSEDLASTLSADWSTGEKQMESLKIPVDHNIYKYVSDVKESDVKFLMLGAEISLKQPADTTVEMMVRTSNDAKDWSSWVEMELDDIDVNKGKMFSENPVLFGGQSRYAQYTLTLSSEIERVTPEVYDVSLIFIDPTDDLRLVKAGWEWLMGGTNAKESVDIITREEWGADESVLDWEPEYAPVEQIVIHHTAGADNSPSDPAAVVRGIYYFHAVEKEWGDIGYNYIIDHKGNIYEGRKGGMGVVAAHTLSNNYGSVGIAVIGNYVNAAPSSNALTALIDMVEYVGYQADLNLTDSHNFNGQMVNVVAGHRDLRPTECPGDVLESMIADIAGAAASGKSSLPEKTYKASYVGQSVSEIELETGEVKTVAVRFDNNGTAIWLKNSDDVVLVPVEPYPRNSGFRADSWKNAKEVGSVSQKSVMPDAEGLFNLDLQGLDVDGYYVEKFALKGPNGILDGTTFEVKINNIYIEELPEEIIDPVSNNNSDNSIEIKKEVKQPSETVVQPKEVSPDLYGGQWVAQSDHVELYPGEETKVWIDIKNTGKVPWYKDGDYPIRLGTSGPIDRNSGFYKKGAGWIASNRIEMDDWTVDPGEVARFEFVVKANPESGVYREYFRPVAEGVTWLDDQGVYIEIMVKRPEYKAEWVAQSESQTVLTPGRKARVWVELKNVGNVIWQKNGDNPVRLGTDRDLDRASIFYSPGYWIKENRAATMKRNSVDPGDTVRFELVVTAPDQPGTYREYFRPVAENMQWMDDLGIYWDVVVE